MPTATAQRPFGRQIDINIAVAVAALVIAPLVNPQGASLGGPVHAALLALVLLSWWSLRRTRSPRALLWWSQLSVLGCALGLRLQLDAFGPVSAYWRAFAAVQTLITMAILFPRARDYAVAVAITLAASFIGVDRSYYQAVNPVFFALTMYGAIRVGSMMNIVIMRSHREMHEATEKYRRLARTDPLTGLDNRRAFMERLTETIAQSTPGRLHMAMLDLDHFKRINDTLGHDAGDAVLVALAGCLLRRWPAGTAARLGGEEFALLLADQTPGQAAQALEQLLQEVQGMEVAGTGFSFSAGLVTARVGEAPSSLLTRADTALYAAKRGGRGRIETVAG
ncbi:GGDEF domain-containing protein [Paracidovorax wautersii]|uniref:diguanylate cyclase n=1 Tax=Paracidovorax wautersii TaxID=1177982 RepID=A0A1I2ATA5_9BURK|nr:GGDEF domain-containing protein [Paracidovorax wautersii]SFE47235.1 diguanylate cyclase (GGDEF) domain-containing protein [Paracidovorax wautersii]